MDGNSHFLDRKLVMEYVKAKKKYGQNFLKDEQILKKIASAISIKEKDLVIEIGPGMGALTKHLFSKGSFLLCYEIDSSLKEYLDKYQTERSVVIYDDFLSRDILSDSKAFSYHNVYVVANIPYYITSPILVKILKLSLFSEIVLLVQKEVAERIVATSHTKEYNSFSLFIDYYYDASLVCNVSKSCFIPSPKVDSAVVHLVKKTYVPVTNKEFYFSFIKDAFKNKRKTLKNNLTNYDWSKIQKILFSLGYVETVRAEEIEKKDFYILVEEYLKEM